MKKMLLSVLVVIFTVSLASSQIRKAALISVYGSRNLSDNPLETKMYEKIMKDTSFNLVPIVNTFDKLIREAFLTQFPFPFIAKEEVVNAPGYADIKLLTTWAKDNIFTTPAEGYVPIAAYGIADDTEAIAKAFELLKDVDAVMIAFIDFNLFDQAGFGGITNKKVRANVNLKIFDRKGERIFKLKERAVSDKGVAAFSGFIANTDNLMPMIESASANLFEDMKEKLPKSLNKMAKKMAK